MRATTGTLAGHAVMALSATSHATGGTAHPGGPTWLVGPSGLGVGLAPLSEGATVATKGLVGPLVHAAGREVERWILSGTASLVGACGRALQSTSNPSVVSALRGELAVMEGLGGTLALLFLLFALIQAVVRQDLSGVVRAVLVRLPLAILLGAGASGLVVVAERAVDEMSSALLGPSGAAAVPVVNHVATLLAGQGPATVLDEGFAGVAVAVVVAAVSLVLWLELVVRTAAIAVATLFLPLVLAGIVWQESARWARRLAETLAALVLAKLVVVAVLVLAARTVALSDGLAGLVEAGALLVLAAFSPFSLLRLVPLVEAGAIGHLEGLGRRFATRGAVTGAQGVGAARAWLAERPERRSQRGHDGGIELAAGVPWEHPSVAAFAGRLGAGGPARSREER